MVDDIMALYGSQGALLGPQQVCVCALLCMRLRLCVCVCVFVFVYVVDDITALNCSQAHCWAHSKYVSVLLVV